MAKVVKPKVIVWVDDEPMLTSFFITEVKKTLGESFEIKFFKHVDTAWNYIMDTNDKICMFILDIMMSPGYLFEHKEGVLEFGTRTGVKFYYLIRRMRGFYSTWVVFLTYVKDPSLRNKLSNQRKVLYIDKFEIVEFEFAQMIKQTLSRKR